MSDAFFVNPVFDLTLTPPLRHRLAFFFFFFFLAVSAVLTHFFDLARRREQ